MKVCHLVNLYIYMYIYTHTHIPTHTPLWNYHHTQCNESISSKSFFSAVCRPSLLSWPHTLPVSRQSAELLSITCGSGILYKWILYCILLICLLSIIILRSIHFNECVTFFTVSSSTLNGFIFYFHICWWEDELFLVFGS